MKIGKIHKPKSLFLRIEAGEATLTKDGKALRYELSTDPVSGLPIIRNETTGLWWTVKWDEIIRLAQQAGIDEEK